MLGARAHSLLCDCPDERKLSANAELRIVVVDDDIDRWTGLIYFLRRPGLVIDISPQIPEGLLSSRPSTPICLILDVKPGRDGLQFQQRLAAANVFVPIIFLADSTDIVMSVRAMKNGAVDFLSRPFRDEDLLEAVGIALARDQAWCEERQLLSMLRRRFETLSHRERQVMEGVVKGKQNKQVAFDLDISEITVKAHRGKVMRKMKATSLPELTRMADKIAQSCPLVEGTHLAVAARRPMSRMPAAPSEHA